MKEGAIVTRDPVEISPDIYKVVLENDRVRVLEVTLKEGQTSPMHWHPAMIIYALASGKARFDFPDGNSQVIELTAGGAVFSEELMHEVTNLGPVIRVLNIELKKG